MRLPALLLAFSLFVACKPGAPGVTTACSTACKAGCELIGAPGDGGVVGDALTSGKTVCLAFCGSPLVATQCDNLVAGYFDRFLEMVIGHTAAAAQPLTATSAKVKAKRRANLTPAGTRAMPPLTNVRLPAETVVVPIVVPVPVAVPADAGAR